MTIAHYDTDEVQALRDRVAELEEQLAATRAVNQYPHPYYSRMTAEPVTLFADPVLGEFAGIMLSGVVVHIDLGNSRGGYHRAYVNGWIKELDKLEDRTE